MAAKPKRGKARERRSLLRLPLQADPLPRRVSRSRMRVRLGLSQQDCASCHSACDRLSGHLREACRSLCTQVCGG